MQRIDVGMRISCPPYHAAVSDPNNLAGNAVTTASVHINLGEARVSFPVWNMHIDLAGRLQDDQPRPSHGFEASVETAVAFAL